MKNKFWNFIEFSFLALSMIACTQPQALFVQPLVPQVQGPTIDAGSISTGESKIVILSNGAEINLTSRGGVPYLTVEGTYSKDSFSQILSQSSTKPQVERSAILAREIERVFKKVKTVGGIPRTQVPEVGYFTFELPYEQNVMSSVKTLQFQHQMILSPVVFDRYSMKALKDVSPFEEGLSQKSGARDSSRGYSGLDRIRAVEFVKQAEADIGGGVSVDGSSVLVGVTDTGVTLNHPGFRSSQTGLPRVTYLKDFTREGRVYFNKAAKFEVKIPADGTQEDLTLNAQVIMTPKLPKVPQGDILTEVTDLKIKVSSQLRSLLTQAGSGAKLGILSESAFQSDSEPVDINGNGSTDDQIYMILIPGRTAEEDVVYVDPSGTADFRNSTPIGDWNRTKTTVPAFSEKFGFYFNEDKLPLSAGVGNVSVRSVSLVGYDPGNHGTHVSGIIGASRMIGNDSPSTLARGVAPEAKLMINRVCANNTGCLATEAFIDLAVNGHAEVINMSLGGLNPFNAGFGVQETLVNRITSVNNVLFIISAGNSGPGRQTVGSPSTAKLSLSIGATATREMIQRQYQWPGGGGSSEVGGALNSSEDSDFMFFFSSRGPTAAGGFKPTLSAPGTELSSVQLNSPQGVRGGLDVYWGTSMAAPTATGAFALFLDAIKKYNLKNPEQLLPTRATILREVLIQSARPFDVSRFDPATGEKLSGQYTWIDQGFGMVDLVAAWKKAFEYRDKHLPESVKLAGKPVELEYSTVTLMKSPVLGVLYDGSRAGGPGTPAFGAGVYLNYFETDTSRQVSVMRKLPEYLASSADAGDLMTQLRTTQDEFVLKTWIYGSDRSWIRAGTLDQMNCEKSDVANLTILGEGASVHVNEDSTGSLNAMYASTLNLCIDRQIIARELTPGDHGALIFGYRTVDGQIDVLPSFTVPVYLTVPHQTLSNSTAYQVNQNVASFGVKRNYVTIPEGTTFVKVTLEVPSVKKDSNGQIALGQSCSGVELMPLLGKNVGSPFKSRTEARIFNCDGYGRVNVDESKKKLSFQVSQPTPGIWDLHVFGSYKYPLSEFNLRMDYVTALTSASEVIGSLSALEGNFRLTLKEASFEVVPDPIKSSYSLSGLAADSFVVLKNGESAYIPSRFAPFGGVDSTDRTLTELPDLRRYPSDVKKVEIATGGSAGNDIDLFILECPAEVLQPTDPGCAQIGKSDGPSDVESVTFEPKLGKAYAVQVVGTNIKNQGKLMSTETLTLDVEMGEVSFSTSSAGTFDVAYSFKSIDVLASRILNHTLFRNEKYRAVGSLSLRSKEGTLLGGLPVTISP